MSEPNNFDIKYTILPPPNPGCTPHFSTHTQIYRYLFYCCSLLGTMCCVYDAINLFIHRTSNIFHTRSIVPRRPPTIFSNPLPPSFLLYLHPVPVFVYFKYNTYCVLCLICRCLCVCVCVCIVSAYNFTMYLFFYYTKNTTPTTSNPQKSEPTSHFLC